MPSRSREFRKQQEKQASWDRLRSAPWRPTSQVRAIGNGLPRVQLVQLPSFSAGLFWEICQHDDDWLLYTSQVVDETWDKLTVQGYVPVDCESSQLKSYVDRLTAVTMPVAPHLNNMDGLDGTVTQLTLFGDLFSEVRFQWWTDYPPGWQPMVEIADEMLGVFEGLAKG